MTARLGLGTAQFGLAYGIANARGKPSDAEVQAVLDAALGGGIALLDTAPAYGDAECRIGACAPAALPIVTKTCGDSDVRTGLAKSLRHLRREGVHALLVHDRHALLGPDGDALFAVLVELRDAGLATKVGVSVYHPHEADTLLARYPLEVMQLPLNVLDQRAHSSGLLTRLAARGVEVHARSPFLQGLLLLAPEHVPFARAAARVPLVAFRTRARELGLTPLQAAIGFARAVPGVDVVVAGVEDAMQLRELVAASVPLAPDDWSDLACDALDVVDPSRWSTQA